MKIYTDIEQNTDEWLEIRLGKFTASPIDGLFAAKTTAAYRNLVRRIAFERITGKQVESFSNDYMNRGNEVEADGLEAYEVETMNVVNRVAFIESDDGKSGCSPDGLLDDGGMVQIKSLKYSTMFDYFDKSEKTDLQFLGRPHYNQVQFEMMKAERKWSDFVLYHPDFPLIIRRVQADRDRFTLLSDALVGAEQEVERLINLVNQHSEK